MHYLYNHPSFFSFCRSPTSHSSPPLSLSSLPPTTTTHKSPRTPHTRPLPDSAFLFSYFFFLFLLPLSLHSRPTVPYPRFVVCPSPHPSLFCFHRLRHPLSFYFFLFIFVLSGLYPPLLKVFNSRSISKEASTSRRTTKSQKRARNSAK